MITVLGISLVLTLTPERVKVVRALLLDKSQTAPIPLSLSDNVYLPLYRALRISTLSIVLFQERFCPTANLTAVRACRKSKLVVGATPWVL